VSKGKFLVLEGIDGAGTTTQAGLLQSWLAGHGIKSIITREPSDGPIGTIIRNALRGRIRLPETAGAGPLAQETIALLFAADRIDHLKSEITPALKRGVWVISDRYVDSSVAYQGTLIDLDWVSVINRYATAPDLTFFLRIDVDTALQRIAGSRVGRELFETRDLLVRVAAGYDTHYQRHPGNLLVLESTQTVETIHRAMCAHIEGLYPEMLRRG
jgi:dTMP kinase